MVKEISTSTEIKNFISHHKVLCVMTLGLAIVAFTAKTLCGRAVSWLKESFGTTKKTDTVATKELKKPESAPPPEDIVTKFGKELAQANQERVINFSELFESTEKRLAEFENSPMEPLKEPEEESIKLSETSKESIEVSPKQEEPPPVKEERRHAPFLDNPSYNRNLWVLIGNPKDAMPQDDEQLKNALNQQFYEVGFQQAEQQELEAKQKIRLKEEALSISTNLKCLIGNNEAPNVTDRLKNLVKSESSASIHIPLKIEHPHAQQIGIMIAYNSQSNKFVATLLGILKEASGQDDVSDMLEYKLTDMTKGQIYPMKQKMAEGGLFSVPSIDALNELIKTPDETSEPLVKEKDSAWIFEYGTEYIIELPEEYHVKPIHFKIDV